jgi:very-short-patch-repair endonuclease
MNTQLVQTNFSLDNISFDCWVIEIDNKFWFKAHDVAVFLEYRQPSNAVHRHVPLEARTTWAELKPWFNETISSCSEIKVPSNWQPHTVFISEMGLKILVTKTRITNVNKIKQFIDLFKLDLNVVPLGKEQSTISAIIDACFDYQCIPQYSVLNYRIDLYLPKIKLAIECDEFNHKAYDSDVEQKREREIREYLNCKFFRYNPDDKNFNVFRMIGQVRIEIALIEQLQKKEY